MGLWFVLQTWYWIVQVVKGNFGLVNLGAGRSSSPVRVGFSRSHRVPVFNWVLSSFTVVSISVSVHSCCSSSLATLYKLSDRVVVLSCLGTKTPRPSRNKRSFILLGAGKVLKLAIEKPLNSSQYTYHKAWSTKSSVSYIYSLSFT